MAHAFRIEPGSGVPVYRQLVQQVRRAVLLGRLHPGDQLPTLSEMVRSLGINQNTVARAYSELEHAGLVVRRQGVGTFIASSPPGGPLAVPRALVSSISRWVDRARAAGLSADQIRALVAGALDDTSASAQRPPEDSGDTGGRVTGGTVTGGKDKAAPANR